MNESRWRLPQGRNDEDAPNHLPSAGEELVKRLVIKQTCTTTTLQEQLAYTQRFTSSGTLSGINTAGLTSKNELPVANQINNCATNVELSAQDLQKCSGLNRHILEEQLSVKPDSEWNKLFKFALSNSAESGKKQSLIEQLPNHPINNLKDIEHEFLATLTTPKPKRTKKRIRHVKSKDNCLADLQKVVCSERVIHRKRRRRHRQKNKSSVDVQDNRICCDAIKPQCPVLHTIKDSCDNRPFVQNNPNDGTDPLVPSDSLENPQPKTSRPSLWDVRDMKAFCKPVKYGCSPRKMYTVKDGLIVQVLDKPP